MVAIKVKEILMLN